MDWCDASAVASDTGMYLAIGTAGWDSSQFHLLNTGGGHDGDGGIDAMDTTQDTSSATSRQPLPVSKDAVVQIWHVQSPAGDSDSPDADLSGKSKPEDGEDCATSLSMLLLLPRVGGAVWDLQVSVVSCLIDNSSADLSSCAFSVGAAFARRQTCRPSGSHSRRKCNRAEPPH